jgi:hypothetical protein
MKTIAFHANGSVMRSVLLTAVLIFELSGVSFADIAGFPQYNPLTLGSYWTYQNTALPFDTYTVSVFENFSFNGYPAAKVGTDGNNYGIGSNNGVSVTAYGYVSNGVLYDSTHTTISAITDGTFYQLGEASNYQLIRIWDNLDSSLKAAYNIDPTLKDLILIAAYDSRYSRNGQNAVVESGLGVSLPDYAVTHLEWYQAGVGMITTTDIFADRGAIGDRYDLVDHYIAPNPVPIPSALLLFSSGLAAFVGSRFGKKGRIRQ